MGVASGCRHLDVVAGVNDRGGWRRELEVCAAVVREGLDKARRSLNELRRGCVVERPGGVVVARDPSEDLQRRHG